MFGVYIYQFLGRFELMVIQDMWASKYKYVLILLRKIYKKQAQTKTPPQLYHVETPFTDGTKILIMIMTFALEWRNNNYSLQTKIFIRKGPLSKVQISQLMRMWFIHHQIMFQFGWMTFIVGLKNHKYLIALFKCFQSNSQYFSQWNGILGIHQTIDKSSKWWFGCR